MTTSRERILAAWRGEPHDHVPLTTWCFGFQPPQPLRWRRSGQAVDYWYTQRLEHIHTLPQPWELDDDFQRVMAWQSLGVDDVLDVSVPWGIAPEVTWQERRVEAGEMDPQYPVMVREYHTPAGALVHAVKLTGEDPGPGWVRQPAAVPLFEDFNIPRAVKHAVAEAADIAAVRYLYQAPGPAEKTWFQERMRAVKAFSDAHGIAVQAWAGFGMDALVWMTGAEGAIYLAMDDPQAFASLLEQITEADAARVGLAAQTDGVDLITERGWYASTAIWSPKLLDRYLVPHITRMAEIAHVHGKRFGYVMTTGIKVMGKRLADAGVDVLYFIDPVADQITLEEARDQLADRMTLVGGISSLTLSQGAASVERATRQAMEVLGKSNRFILQPVDSLFPDTPWEAVQTLIDTWKSYHE
ncbi:MAG TPA: uroporphyrinogen decarboxylase family protein [Anaerolineaceae bacterium]